MVIHLFYRNMKLKHLKIPYSTVACTSIAGSITLHHSTFPGPGMPFAKTGCGGIMAKKMLSLEVLRRIDFDGSRQMQRHVAQRSCKALGLLSTKQIFTEMEWRCSSCWQVHALKSTLLAARKKDARKDTWSKKATEKMRRVCQRHVHTSVEL